MLDVYAISLSASWMSDHTLTTLMGRVPARCILLLEDLDAAFTRSVNRGKGDTGVPMSNGEDNQEPTVPSASSSSRKRNKEQISDVNTLSLSGLLNALDGVAAAEGRLLFA
jgi:chaperone BCS1